MFKCNSSKDEIHEFAPFTLNMKLTTKESARNLFELFADILGSVKLIDINQEQRQIAEDICNMLSNNVYNITTDED